MAHFLIWTIAVLAISACSANADSQEDINYAEHTRRIAEHNLAFSQDLTTFQVAMNHFGRIFPQEIPRRVNGFNQGQQDLLDQRASKRYVWEEPATAPPEKNWVKLGGVSPIKQQITCLSDWAVAAAGALEGQYFRKYKKLPELSVQELVDCVLKNVFCEGGVFQTAFVYVKWARGLSTMATYPNVTGTDWQDCPESLEDRTTVKILPTYKALYKMDEEELMYAVANKGPVAVAIEARWSFMFYKSGLYYEPECSGTKADHAVLVVGYGKDEVTGADYWLVKNSFGPGWGENGYIRMVRNQNNNCCIACYAMYPNV